MERCKVICHMMVSIDGKINGQWEDAPFEHLGKRLLYLQVLTKSAKKEYLAYLRDIGIPYIIAGESATEMDLGLALKKLGSEFGIKSLVVCGGAIINGAFFKDDFIDKISLVVTPYVEGDKEKKTFAKVAGDFNTTAFPLQYAKPIDGGGVHLLYAKGNG